MLNILTKSIRYTMNGIIKLSIIDENHKLFDQLHKYRD